MCLVSVALPQTATALDPSASGEPVVIAAVSRQTISAAYSDASLGASSDSDGHGEHWAARLVQRLRGGIEGDLLSFDSAVDSVRTTVLRLPGLSVGGRRLAVHGRLDEGLTLKMLFGLEYRGFADGRVNQRPSFSFGIERRFR